MEAFLSRPAHLHTAPQASVAAATAAANVQSGTQLYAGLAPLEPLPPPPPRMGKQLHPGWVASRAARPDMAALWNAAEQMRGVCKTRPVAVYMRPKMADVCEELLEVL